MELFIDTETSGFKNPWVVQFGIILADATATYAEFNMIIQSNGRFIESGAERVHGVSTKMADKYGFDEVRIIPIIARCINICDLVVCHNVGFDVNRVMIPWLRRLKALKTCNNLIDKPSYCTMLEGVELCKIPSKRGWKWPKLQELHTFLFNEPFVGAHDAMADIRATKRCYYEMQRLKLGEPKITKDSVDNALNELAERIKK